MTRSTPPTGRARAAMALALVLLAGCSLLPGRQFTYTFPAGPGLAALPVVLTDTTGTVIGLEEAPPGFQPRLDVGMATIAQNPNAVVIRWIGGSCDERVSITEEGSPSVTFVVTTTSAVACDLGGVPRALLLHLSKPADMRLLAVRFEP